MSSTAQIRSFAKQPKHRVLALQIAAGLCVLHFAIGSFFWTSTLLVAMRDNHESRRRMAADYSGFYPAIVPILLLMIYAFISWQAKGNWKNAMRLFVVTTICAFALFVYDVRHDNYQISGEDMRGGPRFYYYFTWPLYQS